ncbi:hypothetical protein [Silvibacterium sp.]|uniref:hypothetical protein n=1 Tax=Silvibacterium sp. TaxID=1964179 RepID=UPI0039E2218C
MAIQLSPELEALVREGVKLGSYASVEEYLQHAILRQQQEDLDTEGHEVLFGESREEFHRKLEEALEQAERGETFTPEQVKEDLRLRKQAWLKARQMA